MDQPVSDSIDFRLDPRSLVPIQNSQRISVGQRYDIDLTWAIFVGLADDFPAFGRDPERITFGEGKIRTLKE